MSFSQVAFFIILNWGKVKGSNAAPSILGTQALTMAWEVRTSCLQDFYHRDLSAYNFTYSSAGDQGIFQITL